jgi:hypothetical protein
MMTAVKEILMELWTAYKELVMTNYFLGMFATALVLLWCGALVAFVVSFIMIMKDTINPLYAAIFILILIIPSLFIRMWSKIIR